MFRNIRRYSSNNSWNLIDRNVSGFIHQQGLLTGIKNINPPFRLSLSPYLATYYEQSKLNNGSNFLYKGGLDLKYGINESFTLDMMLIPDFGQIQSDDEKLNLSPYELYYSEKRQFFTEGTELFQRANIFYSRRIGAKPKFSSGIRLSENETLAYNPNETQLVNATKISGRTNKGWGLGVLNAMSLPSFAEINNNLTGDIRKEPVQPFTNYNITVIDKSLENNSYISLINTNVTMAGHPFHANVTATEFQLRNKPKNLALKGKAAFSTRGDSNSQNGYFASLGMEGNKEQFHWNINQTVYSDKYNPNDLGYLKRNNQMNTESYIYYQITEPFWVIRECLGVIFWNYNRTYNPNTFFDNQVGFIYKTKFKNNYQFEFKTFLNSNQYDYYEPRFKGMFYKNPSEFIVDFELKTDDRKPLNLEIDYTFSSQPEINSIEKEFDLTTQLRLGKKFNFEYNFGLDNSINNRGFTDIVNGNNVIFAQRDISTIINGFESSYTFNNTTNFRIRARHYWSTVENNGYFTLLNNGLLIDNSDYNLNKNQNYNALTLDMIFRWVFAPGSEMNFVWKTFAYSNDNQLILNYLQNLSNSWSNQNSSLSLKLLYYIDYNSLVKVFKK
ncbi:MAG: DUF5916 domain-containing protein [Paludibacter sp.]|nr:DUF5916 domain-containing protein [Paludibacter sp.]